jgi:hypothetical protein
MVSREPRCLLCYNSMMLHHLGLVKYFLLRDIKAKYAGSACSFLRSYLYQVPLTDTCSNHAGHCPSFRQSSIALNQSGKIQNALLCKSDDLHCVFIPLYYPLTHNTALLNLLVILSLSTATFDSDIRRRVLCLQETRDGFANVP